MAAAKKVKEDKVEGIKTMMMFEQFCKNFNLEDCYENYLFFCNLGKGIISNIALRRKTQGD